MKSCPYCAEQIQDAAVVCRFCNRDLLEVAHTSVTPHSLPGKSLYERKLILENAIRSQFTPTMRIESQSDHQAVLVFGRAPNHLLHFFIGLFTFGVWWLVWLLLAISNTEHRRMITVDEEGRIVTSGAANAKAAPAPVAAARTPEELERQRRANHRLGTALVAGVIGAAAIALIGALLLAFLGGTSSGTPARRTLSGTAPDRPSETPQRRAATPAQGVVTPAAWREVKTWTGSGMKETETFQTASREWRIRWKSSNEPFPNAGLLQIYVYDGSGGLLSLAANKQGPGEDESYVRSTPGKHYLMINSANIDWTVTVQDRR